MWERLRNKLPIPQAVFQDEQEYQMGDKPQGVPVQYADINIPGLKNSAAFYQELEEGETSHVVRRLQNEDKAVAASFDVGKVKLFVSEYSGWLTALVVGGVMIAGTVYLLEKHKHGETTE